MTTIALEMDQFERVSQQLDALSQQVRALGQQVGYLSAQAQDAELRREAWDDLQQDVQPIVQDLYDLTVTQLQDIDGEVTLEDMVRLLLRLAGHTRTFEALLGQLESASDFANDAAPITHEMVDALTTQLAALEAKGYFAFARQAMYVLDRVVTSFTEEDVRQLGDNIVLILNTVKSMTQPEIMTLMGKLGTQLQEVERHREALPTGMLALARQMRDPEVRRGLALTLATLKAAGRQEHGTSLNPNGSQ